MTYLFKVLGEKKVYYHGRNKDRPYGGNYIFITDDKHYAEKYSRNGELHAYEVPFSDDKLFSLKNPAHRAALKKRLDPYAFQRLVEDSGEGHEIDWATLGYISTSEFDEAEELFQDMGFLGIKLKERTNIESIYVFDERTLKPLGKVNP